MPTLDGLQLSIDVSRYFRLPSDVRVRFDAWLRAENLIDKKVVRLTLGEGKITVERWRDEDGRLVDIIEEIPASSLPPQEAFGTEGFDDPS